jgi:catechol 2,3-dioxygenase
MTQAEATMTAESPRTQPVLAAATHIGHVHLRVADLDRAIHFYRDIIGFDLLMNFGTAAFLSAGGYHHHLGLNTWESKGGQPPAPGTTGLYHFAINFPERKDLAAALARIMDSGWGIDGASDHGTHEAIYLHDPDHNGIEFAWDRPKAEWPRRGDKLVFDRKPLNFKGLYAELGGPERTAQLEILSNYK